MSEDDKVYTKVEIDSRYYYEDRNGRLYDLDHNELPEQQQSVWPNGSEKDTSYIEPYEPESNESSYSSDLDSSIENSISNTESLSELVDDLFKGIFKGVKSALGFGNRENNYLKFLKFLGTDLSFKAVLERSKWADKTPFFAGKKPLTMAERKIIKIVGFRNILYVSQNLYCEVDDLFGKCKGVEPLQKNTEIRELAEKFLPVVHALAKATKPLKKFIEQQNEQDLERLKKHFDEIYKQYERYNTDIFCVNPKPTKKEALSETIYLRGRLIEGFYKDRNLFESDEIYFQFLMDHSAMTKRKYLSQKVRSF